MLLLLLQLVVKGWSSNAARPHNLLDLFCVLSPALQRSFLHISFSIQLHLTVAEPKLVPDWFEL